MNEDTFTKDQLKGMTLTELQLLAEVGSVFQQIIYIFITLNDLWSCQTARGDLALDISEAILPLSNDKNVQHDLKDQENETRMFESNRHTRLLGFFLINVAFCCSHHRKFSRRYQGRS